jgi:hypothetical protein
MNRRRISTLPLLASLFSGLAATSADAQGRQTRHRDVVVLTLTADASAEKNGGSSETDVRDAEFQGLQSTASFQSSIRYSETQREHFNWQLGASTSLLHYASLGETILGDQRASGALMINLGKRTRIDASQSIGYLPNYGLASLLIAAPHTVGEETQTADQSIVQSTADRSIVRMPSYRATSSIAVSRNLTRRSNLSATYGFQQWSFMNNGEPNLENSNAGARFAYRLTKSSGFHLGYGRRFGQYDLRTGTKRARIDDIDVGYDYNRALQLPGSRRTTVNFTTGSSITGDAFDRRFAVTGNAKLEHRLSSSGRLGLSYERGVRFLDGFGALVFADSVTASASSRLSSKTSVGVAAGYAHGVVGRGNDNALNSWSASGRYIMALKPGTLTYIEYSWNQHAIDGAVQLFEHMANEQSRHTIHAGITVDMALVRERLRERK